MNEQVKQLTADKLVSIESERAVSALFSRRRLPRTYHWLYKRSDDFAQAHMPSVLDKLCDDGMIAAQGDGSWTLAEEVRQPIADDDGVFPRVAAPEWEDELVNYLQEQGVHVQRQREEGGYVLALAMTAFAARLNVEIDGRQHQTLVSQKAKDIARDQRLKAIGWSVLRLSVSEVVSDVARSGDRVLVVWKKLKNGGAIE